MTARQVGGGIQKFRLIQHFQIMKKAHQPREGGGGSELPKIGIFPDALQTPSTSFRASPSTKHHCSAMDQVVDDGTMLF